jgi:hypothetical protein
MPSWINPEERGALAKANAPAYSREMFHRRKSGKTGGKEMNGYMTKQEAHQRRYME